MNIHPIIVHFPIALLTIYTLLELFAIKKFSTQPWYRGLKLGALYIGTIGALAGLLSGEAAEELRRHSALIEVHSSWATFATWWLVAVSILYVAPSISQVNTLFPKTSSILIQINSSAWMRLFAVIGLIAITVTGALGGAIVYGTDADPIVHFVYSLFF